jgi:hypothetical protein
MRTSHGDSVRFQSHQLGEHFGTGNHRNGATLSLNYFRIVATDCGGAHYDVRIAHVAAIVSFSEINAHFLQPISHV